MFPDVFSIRGICFRSKVNPKQVKSIGLWGQFRDSPALDQRTCFLVFRRIDQLKQVGVTNFLKLLSENRIKKEPSRFVRLTPR